MDSDFPDNLDDIIDFKVNIKGLIKILKLLKNYHDEVKDEISTFERRIEKVDFIEKTVTNLEFNQKLLEKNQEDMKNSIKGHQIKIMEIEQNVKKNTKDIDETTEKLNEHDSNLNNLNRVFEEHLTESKDYHDQTDKNTVDLIQMHQKFNTFETNLDKQEKFLKEYEKAREEMAINIDKTKELIESKTVELTEEIQTIRDKTNDSTNELNKDIININDKISEMNRLILRLENMSIAPNTYSYIRKKTNNPSEQTAVNNVADDFEFSVLKDQFNEYKEYQDNELKKIKEKYNNLFEDSCNLKDAIENLKKKNIIFQKDLLTLSQNQKKTEAPNQLLLTENTDNNIKNIFGPNGMEKFDEMLKEKMQKEISTSQDILKLVENFNIVKSNLMLKANQSDIVSLKREMLKNIDKSEEKLSNNISILEQKFNYNYSPSGEINVIQKNAILDYNNIYQSLEPKIEEKIEKKTTDLLTKQLNSLDFNKISTISEIKETINKHTEDLDQTFKSLVEIRTNLITAEFLEKINGMESNILNNLKEINVLKHKFFDLEKICTIDPTDDYIDGNNPDEKKEPISIKERIKRLAAQIDVAIEKSDLSEKKVNSLEKETLHIITQKLKKETEPLFEKFKKKLEEYQKRIGLILNDKVDANKFKDYDYKLKKNIDFKLSKKLERSELEKNTNKINKTIGTLENKISKTLVDTIIDLQLDEAPLIIKKNAQAERCASCNQILPGNTFMFNNTVSNFKINKDKNKKEVAKSNNEKLPEIKEDKNVK